VIGRRTLRPPRPLTSGKTRLLVARAHEARGGPLSIAAHPEAHDGGASPASIPRRVRSQSRADSSEIQCPGQRTGPKGARAILQRSEVDGFCPARCHRRRRIRSREPSATTAIQTTERRAAARKITRERLACRAQVCSFASLPRAATWAPPPAQTKACEAHHLPRLRERDQDGPRSLLRLS
jgi:hypothetical protein